MRNNVEQNNEINNIKVINSNNICKSFKKEK